MRTKVAWLFAVPFLILARPTVETLSVGCVVAAVGLLVRAWAAGTIRKGEALAMTGPYALTRNPLYLGSFLTGVGLTVGGGHWIWPIAFVVFFAGLYVPTMKREEARLRALYGDYYLEYAAKVPAFLPRLTPYRPEPAEDGGFLWSRYLRHREWEGLLGAAAAVVWLALKLRMGW